jgi:hypothetical protein
MFEEKPGMVIRILIYALLLFSAVMVFLMVAAEWWLS